MMRLRPQMLPLVCERCSWNWQMSSAVAVSGARFRNAANRLHLEMRLLCVWLRSSRVHVFDHALAQGS
jgi:hypothetical protein